MLTDLSGRVNDPTTAPNVPVYTLIDGDHDRMTVTISAWNRSRDCIIEMYFVAKTEDCEMRERPLSNEDAEWLANIGARE